MAGAYLSLLTTVNSTSILLCRVKVSLCFKIASGVTTGLEK